MNSPHHRQAQRDRPQGRGRHWPRPAAGRM